MISLRETNDFIEQHYPISMTWETGALATWITWASVKGFLFQVVGENGLEGVAIARPVASLVGLIDNGWQHDENGHYIYIDLAIGHTRRVRQAIAFAILSRFGERESVAFRHNGKLKIHKIDKAREALLGRPHHAI
jgi:hypothetical protein